MFPTSLFFLRHLKTNLNKNEVISGIQDSEVLPGQQIIELSPTKEMFDAVLCSPLKRCRSTISLIADERKLSIKYLDELAERNMGVLEGISRADAQSKYPSLFYGSKIDVSAEIPNGESILEVRNRLKPIASYIIANKNKNILICSHNQTLKILYFLLHEMPVTNDAWQCLNFPNGVLINVSDMKSNNI